MKKLLLGICAVALFLNVNAQTVIAPIDELILPKFMVNGTTAASRVQYVCRLRLTGLTPNATYRYTTGASTNTTLTTGTAPGNMFAINNNFSVLGGHIVGYSSSKSMSGTLFAGNENVTSGKFAELVTDANGNYAGWFAIVPTGNAAFTAGNDVYFYIQLNNGSGGTTITQSYRTTSTIRVINYGTTTQGLNQGTAIRGNSFGPPESFVFGYDTLNARPVFGTWIERDSIFINHTTWYNVAGTAGVDSTNGAWGSVIPNDLPTGIIRIESRNINNLVLATNNSATGIWGATSTVNPSGSTTPIVINSADAPLPVKYKSFTATHTPNAIVIKWSTSTENNNRGFEVQRSVNGSRYVAIGFVYGTGNSNRVNNYSFNDLESVSGNVCYRLKQVDFDGKTELSKVICVAHSTEPTQQVITSPNPFNENLNITYYSNKEADVTVQVFDMLGKVHVNELRNANKGNNQYHINTEALPNGIYFVRITNGTEITTQRIIKK